MRANSGILVLAVLVASAVSVSAHRRNEYLQAARIGISPGRVELQLDLTAGIAVADTVIAAIDRNRDGVLSPDEKQSYAAQVLSGIAFEIDGRAVHVRPKESSFPELDAVKRGEGVIALQWEADLPTLSNGPHHLTYRNTHRRDISVYLANPLAPDSDRIAINDLQRDTDQHDLTIDYALREGGETSPTLARVWLSGWIAAAAVCVVFLLRPATRLTAVPRAGDRAWVSSRRPRFHNPSETGGGSRT